MSKVKVITLSKEFAKFSFVGDRTPASTDEQLSGAFAQLASYRDGSVFIGHYAGNSEWERHTQGDEIVYVLEGQTTLTFLQKMRKHRIYCKPVSLLSCFIIFTASPL